MLRTSAWSLVAGIWMLLGAALADEVGFPEVRFSVLSYNVHGLPAWVVDDDPEQRTPRIAALLGAYDVALIQEDWAYHELLTRGTGHELIERGNLSRLALAEWISVLGGSGLTVLARTSSAERVSVSKQPYSGCSGWLGGANDCLATKGFTRLRLRFAGGSLVDFYTTHLDAGGGEDDQAVRVSQIAQLTRAVRQQSSGVAVIIAGDFNLHFDRPEHRAVIDRFGAELRLSRSEARGDPERWSQLDYLWYRSGAAHALELLESGEALEFVHDGVPLSDHPPLYGKFALRPLPS